MPDVVASLPPLPPPSPSLRVDHHDLSNGWCVVSVEGEIDLATAPGLETALWELRESSTRTRFALDLSEVGHIDSSGLAVLIGFQTRLPAGGAVILVAVRPPIAHVLRLMGLERKFDMCDSVQTIADDQVTRLATDPPVAARS